MAESKVSNGLISGGFNIDGYRNKVTNVARPYLFYVTITPPGSTTNSSDKNSADKWETEYMAYLVKATTIPDRTVGVLETSWQGYKYYYGGTSEWQEWTCNFIVDSNYKGIQALLNWIDMIHNPITNDHGDPIDYATTGIFITQLKHQNENYTKPGSNSQNKTSNPSGKALKTWQLMYGYPTKVPGYALDYSSTTTVIDIGVTFRYLYAKAI